MRGAAERLATAGRPPNVVVIVLDCVRASDFPGGASPVRMPFVEELARSSVTFPRAVSVAPWTLPSHASVFTGLYPWEHGCHGRASLQLPPQHPRLAAILRQAGYATASFSANPIISPSYGLADGFDLAEWGEWWEQVHRWKARSSHSRESRADGPPPIPEELSARDRTARSLKTALTRLPATLAVGESIGRRTVDPRRRWVGNMNPWIEPDVARWLQQQPAERPTFVFVNLIDAHEPYLLEPSDAASISDWWRYMRIPQDVIALLANPMPPRAEDLTRLHELYRRAIAGLDRRIERLVAAYRDAGRWENTLFVLTSDHGQAFGEHGMIWHGVRTDEEMLRVPLLVRLPGDEFGGTRSNSWATPMDVAPTVLEATGLRSSERVSGVSLRTLASLPRPGALLAAGDGTEWNAAFFEHLSPRRRTELNQFSIAAYSGDHKIVVDALSGAVREYDLGAGSPTELPRPRTGDRVIDGMVRDAQDAAERLMRSPVAPVDELVDERLRSWGYG